MKIAINLLVDSGLYQLWSNDFSAYYYSHQGYNSGYTGTGTPADRNNHANQMNPNNTSGKNSNQSYAGSGQTQANQNNHSNQCNPNNPNHQGYNSGYRGTGTPADRNNHANQMNPNNTRHAKK